MQNTSSNPRPGYPVHTLPANQPPAIVPPIIAATLPPATGAPASAPIPSAVAAARVARVDAAAALGAESPGPQDPMPAPEPPLYPNEVISLALKPAQLTAIQKMLSGHSLGASAGAAGVTRQTLYHWIHHDPKFQAAYNAWQHDVVTSVRTKLLAMGDPAVNTVARAVKHDPKIALVVLKAIGTLTPPTPGSTDPEEVEQRMQLKRAKEQQDLDEQMYWSSITGSGLGTGPEFPLKAKFSRRRGAQKRKRG